MEERRQTIAAAAEGTLTGRIARLSIRDARPSLAFRIQLPVLAGGAEAALRVDLRHPQVRGWRDLRGREYRFDDSTRRYEKADGETYALDDVFSDLRAAGGFHDTFVSRVAFGPEGAERLSVAIAGTVRMAEGFVPFAMEARVAVGGVIVENGTAEEAARQLDPDAYRPAVVRDGFPVFDPKF